MQEMVTTLEEAGEIELLALAYAFGGLVSGNEAYDAWFKRSFAMLEDILEESWTYQEMIKKGMQKGLERGLEEGLEKGREEERQRRVQEQRETLLSFVQMRFPELVPEARQQVSPINDPGALHDLIIKLFAVQTAEEARQALMEAGTES
jgi:predicted transposase YdaD